MGLRICEQPPELAPWQQLQPLLDASFSRPPRDVIERVVPANHRRQRLLADGSTAMLALPPQAPSPTAH